MPIERKYLEYYYLVGLYLNPDDEFMSANEDDQIVYLSIDDSMIYLGPDENPNAIPVKVQGYQWLWLWWMYRLSERSCTFADYLAEYLVPICRKYIVSERKRLEDKKEEEE